MPQSFRPDRDRANATSAILAKLEPIDEPEMLAADLLVAIIALLAKAHPPKLDAKAKASIREIYPPATEALIKERALSDSGVAMALAMAHMLGDIAIAYSPTANFRSQVAQDDRLPPGILADFQSKVAKLFAEGVRSGLSLYGVVSVMIGQSTVMAQAEGLHAFQGARPLIECVKILLERSPSSFGPVSASSQREAEEAAISALCQQMGISRATALKYMKEAKRMMGK